MVTQSIHNTRQEQLIKDHMTFVPRKTCSKMQWLYHTMSSAQSVQPKGHKKHPHSSQEQFKTEVGGNSSCQEKEGCMSTANMTAALFGLYYYDGCRDLDRQWAVEQTIDGKVHVIRMRMYNPNYKRMGSKLKVMTKINSDYAERHNHKLVGENKEGFWLSHNFQDPLSSSSL